MRTTLLVVSCALAAGSAHAQPSSKALGQQKFAEGKLKYAAGDFQAAAVLFEAAYQADPDPAYIFNVGQAYRRSAEKSHTERDCYQAMRAYRRFLAQLPEAANRSEVEDYLQTTTRCAGALADKPVDKPIDKPVDKPVDKPIEPPPPSPERGMTTAQWTGVGAGALGVAAVGFAAYFMVQGRATARDHDDLIDRINRGELPNDAAATQQLADLDDRGASQNLKAYVGWGIGGALLIGGAVLIVKGGRAAERKVVLAPSTTGALVLGSFRF